MTVQQDAANAMKWKCKMVHAIEVRRKPEGVDACPTPECACLWAQNRHAVPDANGEPTHQWYVPRDVSEAFSRSKYQCAICEAYGFRPGNDGIHTDGPVRAYKDKEGRRKDIEKELRKRAARKGIKPDLDGRITIPKTSYDPDPYGE